jgi:hypothetical protein
MKKLFLLGGIAISTATSTLCTPAMAQEATRPATVDLATFDCRTLLAMNGDYRDNAVLFLHGYVSGQKKQTVIELAPIAAATDKIIDYCITNPSANAIAAFTANR